MPRALLPRVALPFVCAALCARPASAGDEPRWGVTLWGLSYHVDRSIDYAQDNWGAGVRYYLATHVFVEGDALRNSNRGLVLPASIGVEVGIGHAFHACDVKAVGALTVAYYQNDRTGSDYVKAGPVPGIAFRCGRWQPNIVAILSPSTRIVAAIAASFTILF